MGASGFRGLGFRCFGCSIMKFSSTAVGGVENRVRVIHMGGFTETMVFFDLHTHPKIFGLPDRHLVSKRDFGHRAGNF